jgi:four helix bundle protein
VDKHELEKRTRDFSLRLIRFVEALPKNKASEVIGSQVLRSGTSIGANYREANRAESANDFIHKLSIVEKEAAETQYWLELLSEAGLGSPSELDALLRECGELLAIFTAACRTAKLKRNSNLKIGNSK